jgi:hypothetical protein
MFSQRKTVTMKTIRHVPTTPVFFPSIYQEKPIRIQPTLALKISAYLLAKTFGKHNPMGGFK